jgi:hypothetical protein
VKECHRRVAAPVEELVVASLDIEPSLHFFIDRSAAFFDFDLAITMQYFLDALEKGERLYFVEAIDNVHKLEQSLGGIIDIVFEGLSILGSIVSKLFIRGLAHELPVLLEFFTDSGQEIAFAIGSVFGSGILQKLAHRLEVILADFGQVYRGH